MDKTSGRAWSRRHPSQFRNESEVIPSIVLDAHPAAGKPRPKRSGDGAPSYEESRGTDIAVGAGSDRRSAMRVCRKDPKEQGSNRERQSAQRLQETIDLLVLRAISCKISLMEPMTVPTHTESAKAPSSPLDRVRIVSTPGTCGGKPRIDAHRITVKQETPMTIAFEIPHDIEEQIRTDGADLNRDAKEVYLMEQFRQAKITHRQLEEALALSFHETEQLLKQRGLGQDLDIEDFNSGRDLLRKAGR
jgi:hypothetical protein